MDCRCHPAVSVLFPSCLPQAAALGLVVDPAGAPYADITADSSRRCKKYANEYDFFFPPWILQTPYTTATETSLCASQGSTWDTMGSGGSGITSFKIDGSTMTSMSGR